MSENFLTPAEIEALLGQSAAVNAASQSVLRSDNAAGVTGNAVEIAGSRQLSATERKRRNRLWAIHEQAARDAGAALSAMLRAAVDVRLSAIDAVACHNLATNMETPTCACLLRSKSIAGQFVLELSSEIVLPMLDRMLGGSIDTSPSATNRKLSEIEQRLALRLAHCVAQELNRTWCSTFQLALDVDRIETDARWLTIGPPESEAVLTTFDVRLGKARGAVRFSIPPQAVDVLEHRLAEEPHSNMPGPHFNSANLGGSAEDIAEISVELSPSPTTAEDIASLSVGDVIATDHRIDAPVVVRVDGEPKYLGRLGATAGRKAVRIETPSDP